MSEQKNEDKTMDPVVVSSLVALATQIVSKAVEYNDPNLQAPSADQVQAHLEGFKNLQALPEQYDVGFVNGIVGQVEDWIKSKKIF